MSDVIATRYARALFELAREASDVEGWGRHLNVAAEAAGRPEVARTLSNPRVSRAQAVSLAEEVGRHTSAPVGNLLRLLVERRRVAALPDIVAAYRRLVDRESGMVRAEVTTAVPIDPRLEAAIRDALAERLGGAVQTEVHQDGSILGGLVIRIGDRIIDDSLRTHLQQLRAALA